MGFDTIKRLMPAGEIADKGKICVATVKGDIHDIGKNIVKMLLDNYGYTVFDLGRDVDPQEVLRTVQERDIKLVGLSALMTTTVVAMEETIKLLHAEVPGVKIIVGGAVLTPNTPSRSVRTTTPRTPPKALVSPKRSSGSNTTETTEHQNVPHAPLGTCGTLE